MEEILTLQGAAKYLKLAPITLYRKARKREIPAAKLGKVWRFHRGQLEEWIKHTAAQPLLKQEPARFRHLSSRETEVVLKFIKVIQTKYKSRLESVILYGSRARGDFRADSDIDLLLVLKEASDEKQKEISSLTHRFNLNEDARLQPFLISSSEWRGPSFRTFLLVERIRREGIPLYG